jgi:hypothetical protein
MGTTTANGGDTRAYFLINSFPSPATEPVLTNFNVTYIRTYNRTVWSTRWFNISTGDGFSFRFGALTFLSNNTNTHTITGVYGTNSTFTATNINLSFQPQFTTGVVTFTGAFSLAGSLFTYNNDGGFSNPTGITFSSTTTLNVSNAIAGDLDLSQLSCPITFTGAVSSTGITTDSSLISTNNTSYTTLFSSTYTSTYGGFNVISNNITFTGAISITDPISFYAYTYGTLTISDALSITGTTLRDGLNQTLTFVGNTLSTSSTATNWTFTNARPIFSFGSAMTVANPVSLVNSGGLYFGNSLTLTSALSSSGASQWNVLAATTSGLTLTLNNAVTLVNCQLAATTITVAGGASKNFAYSLSTPIANNTPYTSTVVPYGVASAQNYPEICADTFTLTNTGGTFSIAGGGSAIYRTLFRPYLISGSPACTLTLPALTPTLTDVDFWRVTVAGAVTKPLTGTRLGNVGTITNITTAATKSVYWVGGAGAWSDAKWALTSGGTGSAANYPLPQDTVTFNANSGTGAITYPASVRVGNLFVDDVPAGTTSVYCNSTNSTTSPSYLWVSGGINGPASTPTGTFILGNTSSFTYDSTLGTQLQTVIIADGSSGATHTINPINLNCMQYGTIQFATLGTTTISNSITTPLAVLGNYTGDTYTINITAAQIGSSSYDYSSAAGCYISIGTTYGLGGGGTVNYGACSLYTYQFYVSSLTSNTAYSANISQLSAGNCITLGNINFTQGTVGSTIYQLSVSQDITLLSLSILSKSNFTGTTLRVTHASGSTRNISMYSLTATYSGSLTTMAISQYFGGGKPTFIKLGGGSVGVTGVNVTSIDASPANTWYTTGTVTSSTGWNAGAAPNSKGGFLLFQ